MTQVWAKMNLIAITLVVPQILLAQEIEERSADPIFVKTYIAEAANAEMTRQFFGRIAARDTVDVSFEVGGYLEFLEAREGAVIPAGTTLAKLDLDPFEWGVERAELSLAQAERDMERLKTLANRNVSSEVLAQDAETARDLADVALREAREALEDAQLKAPFDALVADRLGTPFITIAPGQTILRLHDMSEIRVEFDLPERLLAQIGDPADVTFEGHMAGLEGPMALEFREFRTETGGIGQSYTISLAADPIVGPVLLPGRTIIVQARVSQQGDGVVLPASAIGTEPDGQTYVVGVEPQGDGLVARHIPVDVQSDTGTTFRVSGVPVDAEVVAVGAHLVDDGVTVKRFTGLTVEGS